MKEFETYTALIHHDFPDFNISSIKKIGEGDNSVAFSVNDDYIFRFAKREEVKIHIRRETLVFPKIKSALNLQIPEFEFISPETNFVSYKKIEGDILSDTIFQSLKKKEQAGIQKTIANFLSQIHSFPLAELKKCGLETMHLYDEYSENLADAQRLIFPMIPGNEREIIAGFFTEYLSNENNFNYPPTLVHNDFSKDHILFNSANKQITGIIDFGDIAFGDPDYDFLYLLDEFGEAFLEETLKYYQLRDHNVPLIKIYFFSLANKIQTLFNNIKDDDDDGIKTSLKHLNKWFKKNV
jgi:aminoglycoside 2''-phosphotransferase